MFSRDINILINNSFLLFGARGTGKTSWLKSHIDPNQALWIDLLKGSEEQRYNTKPDVLIEELERSKKGTEWVVIDEVQKAPKLLDIVHWLIEEKGTKFALTGSSARKLKKGAANLLAGRAFVYHLFPLTHREMKDRFHLDDSLRWGTLPRISALESAEEKAVYLETYAHTYLKEEILAEQLVRQVMPFRRFIEIAAQTSSSILNYRRIASEIGSDPKTVKTYYEILEDTLLGFFLPAFHRSLRKQQRIAPKFYLFDVGVRRALEGLAGQLLVEGNYEFGRTFEEFIICEIMRLNSYGRKNFSLSYLRTEGGLEVDLVLERPGARAVLVEIKSSSLVQDHHLQHLRALSTDFPEFEAICLSREPRPRVHQGITIYPWQEGVAALGL